MYFLSTRIEIIRSPIPRMEENPFSDGVAEMAISQLYSVII